jgi:hypothetical protein
VILMKIPNNKWLLICNGLLLFFVLGNAQAVPSFARQTGMTCATCHRADYPELTAFGRNFKLNGYTLSDTKQIEATSKLNNNGLKINAPAPLSAMLMAALTSTAKPTDTGAQKDAFGFPQELSLFYAGEMSPNMGTFLQMTYEQESDHFSWDNADIRYANHSGNTTYGFTLNNSPTVQDLWNSTPVWGFPYSGPAAANEPANSTLLEGMLAQDVAGLGAYGMWNNQLYTELTFYKSAHLGETQPTAASANTLSGYSPYWRIAWDRPMGENDFMVGMHGMMANIYPSGTSGATDDYNDVAIDTQYQGKALSVHASYITEKRTLGATNPGTAPALNTMKVDGTYFMGQKTAATLSYFDTSGDSNTAWGTASNSPDSNGVIAQVSYLPWQNTKFTAQYRMYGKFDGTTTNAADNNSLYLLAWLMW